MLTSTNYIERPLPMNVKASIRNEQIKSWSNFLSGIGVVMLAVGVLGPAFLHFSGQGTITVNLAIVYLFAAVFVHLLAQSLLLDLEVE